MRQMVDRYLTVMCLLVFSWQISREHPLIVAANARAVRQAGAIHRRAP